MNDYTVKVAGFFYGTYYAAGAVLKLHPRQAQYELMLGNLAPHVPTEGKTPVGIVPPGARPRQAAKPSRRVVVG